MLRPGSRPRLRLLWVSRSVVVLALGTTQTLAWASSYYLEAIVADPVSRELGISATAVFAAFSAALLLPAALDPAVGRIIDRRGGQGVLCLSNLVFAASSGLLAIAHGPVLLTVAWLVLGAGMALGLYDSAFATLAGLYGRDARDAITAVTLIAGFASTVGWPLSAFLDNTVGWRGACLAWTGLHMMVGLPLNRFLVPPAPSPSARGSRGSGYGRGCSTAGRDGTAGVRVRRDLGGQHRDGRAPAATAAGCGCERVGHHRRGCPGGAGAGGRASDRVRPDAPGGMVHESGVRAH